MHDDDGCAFLDARCLKIVLLFLLNELFDRWNLHETTAFIGESNCIDAMQSSASAIPLHGSMDLVQRLQ